MLSPSAKDDECLLYSRHRVVSSPFTREVFSAILFQFQVLSAPCCNGWVDQGRKWQLQKQYFEQRRQQKQQQTVGLEGYDDGKQSCNQKFESSRSLDIMSLPNVVSTTTQNDISPLLKARNDLEDDDNDYDVLDYQNSCSPVLYANKTIPVVECQEEQNPSSYHTDNDHLNDSSRSLCDPNETLSGRGKKHDNLKLSTVHEISIFDLLDDDDDRPNDAEQTPVNAQESHVAFSVEGLGKVEPETPVHSPKMPGRCNPNGSSNKQARRNLFPCKFLDNGLFDCTPAEIRKLPPAIWSENVDDVKMQDFDLSCRDSFLGQSLRSGDIIGEPNDLISPKNSPPFNWNCRSIQGAFGCDEQSYGIRESDIWNDPNFFEDKTDDVRAYESLNEKWMDQRDFGCDDYFNSKDHWSQDISFGSWNLQDKRSRGMMKGRAIDMTASVFEEPLSYTRHQPLPYTRNLNFGMDNDVKDLNPFVDDTRETLSLPSEESSTSPAAEGNAMKTLIYKKMRY